MKIRESLRNLFGRQANLSMRPQIYRYVIFLRSARSALSAAKIKPKRVLMIITVPRRAYTSDLLTSGKVPLPLNFPFAIGNGAEFEMHGGKLRGTLRIVAHEEEQGFTNAYGPAPVRSTMAANSV
jgi:hypothetical protein